MGKFVWFIFLQCVEFMLAQPLGDALKQKGGENDILSTTTKVYSLVTEKLTSVDSIFQSDVTNDIKYVDAVLTRLEQQRSQLIDLIKNGDVKNGQAGLQGYLWEMTEKLLNRTNEQIEAMEEQKSKLTASLSHPYTKSLPENPFNSNQRNLYKAENQMSTTSESSDKSTISSKVLCQFFIFGTLFGVICSISTCTCFLHPRRGNLSQSTNSRRRRHRIRAVEDLNPSRIPQPFDYTKPCKITFDERGLCYASPLNDEEVPPLPTYERALTLPTSPLPPSAGKKDKSCSSSSSNPNHSIQNQTTAPSQPNIFTTQVNIELTPNTSRNHSAESRF